MARLGSVLGGILADLSRARVAADQLTKEIAAEYERDPLLASMSVPRIALSEAVLTLRFIVRDVLEVEASQPDATVVRDEWLEWVRSEVLPTLLNQSEVTEAQQARFIAKVLSVSRLTLASVRAALAGDDRALARETAEIVVGGWSALPLAVRRQIGTKSGFRATIERRLLEQVPGFVARQQELTFVRAALASAVDIAVRGEDLSAEEGVTQEFRLTLRGADLETVINPELGGR